MTSIKVSQLPAVELLSLTDQLIVNDTDKTPTATSKTSIGDLFTFAGATLTFPTDQITLVTPSGYTNGQYNPSQVVSKKGKVGADGGVIPPIPPGGLNTQEDYNIFVLLGIDALDTEIVDIKTNGAGVVQVTLEKVESGSWPALVQEGLSL